MYRKVGYDHFEHVSTYVARFALCNKMYFIYDIFVDGRIILRWIFRKWERVMWTGWSWLRIGTGGGHL